MKSGAVVENLVAAVAERCRSGLDPEALRAEVLPRLRRAVPIDALWWATAEPSTLLFTQAYREEIPEETGPYFVENEFLRDDVNKWTELARDRQGVRTLLEATAGNPASSARYQEIFRPLGLEDELRAVLRSRGVSWGFMCLHREMGSSFSREETAFVRRLAPHLAEGIRLGVLMRSLAITRPAHAPGLIAKPCNHAPRACSWPDRACRRRFAGQRQPGSRSVARGDRCVLVQRRGADRGTRRRGETPAPGSFRGWRSPPESANAGGAMGHAACFVAAKRRSSRKRGGHHRGVHTGGGRALGDDRLRADRPGACNHRAGLSGALDPGDSRPPSDHREHRAGSPQARV